MSMRQIVAPPGSGPLHIECPDEHYKVERVAQRWAPFALLCGSWTIIARMSRLRRLVLSDRWFFITCRLLRRRHILSDSEVATLAEVIDGRRAEHGFVLTAWVFLPDHTGTPFSIRGIR